MNERLKLEVANEARSQWLTLFYVFAKHRSAKYFGSIPNLTFCGDDGIQKTSQKNTKLFSRVAHTFLESQQVLVLSGPDYGWNVFFICIMDLFTIYCSYARFNSE